MIKKTSIVVSVLGLILISSQSSMSFAAEKKRCYSFRENRNVPCQDLSRSNFAGRDLRGADWSGANLVSANLAGAILQHSYLIEADLSRANLKGADLYAAKLYGAQLAYTRLDGADLRGSHLHAADLSQAIITDSTQLNGASFDRATKLPLAWGENALYEAIRRGMLPIRE